MSGDSTDAWWEQESMKEDEAAERESKSELPTPEGSVDYKHKWEITIEADSPGGAMDAVWHCWEAWRDGNEPIGMSCPASMGDRVMSRVKKVH
jgi:hypothetical protein